MVVGAFPVAKLGALLIRQISKPLANAIAKNAKQHPWFSRVICMPPAQFYNWCEVRMKLWVLNLGKPVKVPKLNEAMAIELGASLLGEFIIFLIAAGLLLAEYTRQTRKETAKEIARQEEIYKIQLTVKELNFQTERQDTQIRELLETISDLEKRVSKVPWNRNKPELPETRTLDESDSLQDIKYYHQKGFGTPLKMSCFWPEKKSVIFIAVEHLSKDVYKNVIQFSDL
ncbi:putative OPA3-like protein CG13603 [Homalodisca vitripennis]|uniref:putative OPA3-like protein CG13603 n=1 Tax=Homalodisca vitripennis TaxID=197043 RepID=UPI001EEBB684|nr:putative OPA3-like protein CG13603 [Homalodisca vitripennis]